MHHDDLLQELLDAVEEHIASLNSGVLESTLWYRVEQALAPFRPDPEEELIEAMAERQANEWLNRHGLGWNTTSEETKNNHRDAARVALQVIKEKGYFNDQR